MVQKGLLGSKRLKQADQTAKGPIELIRLAVQKGLRKAQKGSLGPKRLKWAEKGSIKIVGAHVFGLVLSN